MRSCFVHLYPHNAESKYAGYVASFVQIWIDLDHARAANTFLFKQSLPNNNKGKIYQIRVRSLSGVDSVYEPLIQFTTERLLNLDELENIVVALINKTYFEGPEDAPALKDVHNLTTIEHYQMVFDQDTLYYEPLPPHKNHTPEALKVIRDTEYVSFTELLKRCV